jgi:hypothetical protein
MRQSATLIPSGQLELLGRVTNFDAALGWLGVNALFYA